LTANNQREAVMKIKQKEDALDPECRPIAAVLFMSGAVRLECDFHRLCEVIAETQAICPLSKLGFKKKSGGLYSEVIYTTLLQMHNAGLLEWDDAGGLLTIKRNGFVFDDFVHELNRIPGFESPDIREKFRRAGIWIARNIHNDATPVRRI
jgi:hypothetical protein